jgi:hypothetical protein
MNRETEIENRSSDSMDFRCLLPIAFNRENRWERSGCYKYELRPSAHAPIKLCQSVMHQSDIRTFGFDCLVCAVDIQWVYLNDRYTIISIPLAYGTRHVFAHAPHTPRKNRAPVYNNHYCIYWIEWLIQIGWSLGWRTYNQIVYIAYVLRLRITCMYIFDVPASSIYQFFGRQIK